MKSKRLIWGNLIVLVVCLLFYMLFWVTGETMVTKDSPSYIQMGLSREPFYPAFLAFFRMIFGAATDFYLIAVTFVQSIIQAVCVFIFIRFFRKQFNIGVFVTSVLTMICLSVSLLLRFAAKRSYMYNNAIMTEALCIPLFLLFSVLVLDYAFSLKRRYLVGALAVSFILISTRKQMYITLILLFFIVIFRETGRCRARGNKKFQSFIKGLVISVISLGIVIGANKGFEITYSYFVNGEASSHFNDNRFLTTVVFYVAEPEDSEAIEDPEIRQLFNDIYAICDADGSMMHSAEGNIIERTRHFEEHYDMIQINHMWGMLEDFADARVEDDGTGITRETYVDEISSIISKSLIPKVWPELLELFGLNCLEGVVNTLAKASPIFYIYSFGLVGLYLVLFIINIRRRGWTNINIFALYALFALIINVCVVSLVIFCQSRYMIYNMPIFYAATLMLVRDTLRGKEKNVRN